MINRYYRAAICHGENCEITGVEIKFKHIEWIECITMNYHEIIIDYDLNDLVLESFHEEYIKHVLLYLPNLT